MRWLMTVPDVDWTAVIDSERMTATFAGGFSAEIEFLDEEFEFTLDPNEYASVMVHMAGDGGIIVELDLLRPLDEDLDDRDPEDARAA